jgi:desampylase
MWGMTLRISREHHRQMLSWAETSDPLECCGLLLGVEHTIHSIMLTRNVSQKPHICFEIDPHQLIAAERDTRSGGLPILGYFHSHPNGLAQPSIEDAANAADDGRYWLVIANNTVTAWQAVSKGNLFTRFNPIPMDILSESVA